MKFQKIRLTAILSFLITLSTGEFPTIINSQLKISSSLAIAQINIVQTNADKKAEADRLLKQGIEQYQNSQFQAALQSWQQALIICREIKDRSGEGNALGNLGLAYYSLGNYTKAIDYHQQHLVIAREIKDYKAEGYALGNLGNAYHYLGQHTTAIDYYKQALTIARKIKGREIEGKILLGLGLAYDSLGNYTKAIDYYQQSLVITREIKDIQTENIALERLRLAQINVDPKTKARKSEADRLWQQGRQQDKTSQFQAALQSWQQALIIYQEIKDRQSEGNTLNYLGLVYSHLDQYTKAIEYEQQSLAIAREIKDSQTEGVALDNLGNVYHSLGEYTIAIDCHKLALLIYHKIKDRQGEDHVLNNLGLTYHSLGEYTIAIDYFKQALVIARESKDRQSEGYALGNLGNAYDSLGKHHTAINYYKQTLLIARESKDRQSEETALGNLGLAYQNLGQYPTAINYHNQQLASSREIKDRQGEGISLNNLGLDYYFLGQYPTAIDYHKQGLVIARKIKYRQLENIILANLGLILYKQGNFNTAEKSLFASINISETLRSRLDDTDKISIFDTQKSPYINLQKVLVAENKTKEALEISERGRARAFVELLASRLSSSVQTNITPLNIQQIQQIASEQNSTVVEYSIIWDESIYIWVVKPTGEIVFHQLDIKSLNQQQHTSLKDFVNKSRNSIGVRGLPVRAGLTIPSNILAFLEKTDEATAKDHLRQLYQILIQPIADILPKDPNQRVIFIPHDALFLVPFPALLDANGKYLIEQHTILTAPSIQVLDLTQKQKKEIDTQSGLGKSLVVGNPTMPSVPYEPGQQPQPLPQLPGAEQEAIAIAPLLQTQPLTGNQATKSAIIQKMQESRIIHLATHGLLDDLRGLGSAIALAPDPRKPAEDQYGRANGLLTAEEILDMKLKADLIVLSACNTGRGKITGDGVIGLSRSLISAGIPSVMVSLWSVPDAPTAELMTDFYNNWQKQHMDKAQALRQAMLNTMKTHPHPIDWAAFTLIGEAN